MHLATAGRLEVDLQRLIHALESAISTKQSNTPEGRERLRSYVRALRDIIGDLSPLVDALSRAREHEAREALFSTGAGRSSASGFKMRGKNALGGSSALLSAAGGALRDLLGFQANGNRDGGRKDGERESDGTAGQQRTTSGINPDTTHGAGANGSGATATNGAEEAKGSGAAPNASVANVSKPRASHDHGGNGGGNGGNGGPHPLHSAVLARDAAQAVLLLSLGHRRQERDSLGRTALHCAVQASATECIRVLVGARKEPGSAGVLAAGDARGRTALHWAAAAGDLTATRALLGTDRDADDAPAERKSRPRAETTAEPGGRRGYLDARDDAGCTPLHAALYAGHTTTARALISAGASLDVPDDHGMTAEDLLDLQAGDADGFDIIDDDNDNDADLLRGGGLDALLSTSVGDPPCTLTMDDVAAYSARVEFLAGLIEDHPSIPAVTPRGVSGLGANQTKKSGKGTVVSASPSAAPSPSAGVSNSGVSSGSVGNERSKNGRAGAAAALDPHDPAALVSRTVERVEDAEREALFGDASGIRRRHNNSSSNNGSKNGAIGGLGSGADVEQSLEEARRHQDALAGDLEAMTGSLKRYHSTIQQRLRGDAALLDDAGRVVDGNAGLMSRTGERLRGRLQSTSRNTLLMWMVILAVVLLFFGTFVFIKIFPKRRR